MIKNGFLQQNAFDDVDVFSVPEKQIQILELMMSFYERARAVIKQGAPLLKITALDVREEIIRIKTTITNDQLELIKPIEMRMEEQFTSIERIYRKAVI
jgi:V/A-type H+/Na+-transporting ATPase subunit A